MRLRLRHRDRVHEVVLACKGRDAGSRALTPELAHVVRAFRRSEEQARREQRLSARHLEPLRERQHRHRPGPFLAPRLRGRH